jgi:putative phosphoesterase
MAMRIAILSDIHDNLWNLAAAISHISTCEMLICCGDLCSPFVMDELATFPGPVNIVFGNNDADLFRITKKSSQRLQAHGELFETIIDGKRIAVNHFDYIARGLAHSGLYDVVFYGHNHRIRAVRVGAVLAVNPGPIMGAAFGPAGREDVPPTFVIFDTAAPAESALSAFQITAAAGGDRTAKSFDLRLEDTW